MNKFQNIFQKKTYIIGEMSANHRGSIQHAKEIIHAVKEAGADCIKLQTYTPDTMTIDCHNHYFQISHGLWTGENLYSLYKNAYTPWEWQAELKNEAEGIGLDFLSTPFDKTAVDFLEKIGIKAYKIASFELVDLPLIEYTASKGKPIFLSTGMGAMEEIEDAIATIKKTGNKQLALLKCSSAYPAISDEMNLKTIVDLKERFQVPVGLSDHSLGSLGAVTAVALGGQIIEKHVCLSRTDSSPDALFSMEPNEFAQMVKEIRQVEKALGTIHYGPTKQEENNIIFRRSIFAVKEIKQGELLTEENIRVIRPGYGLKPKDYKEILGKSARQSIEKGSPISWEMVLESKSI